MNDLSNLLACPYCGTAARFGNASWTNIEKIECPNWGRWIDGVWHLELGCKQRPAVYGKGATVDERTASAIAKWKELHDTFSKTEVGAAQDGILEHKLHEA